MTFLFQPLQWNYKSFDVNQNVLNYIPNTMLGSLLYEQKNAYSDGTLSSQSNLT